MPDRWADYLVSAVSYNVAGTHIRVARVHRDDGEVSPPVAVSRMRMLRMLRSGSSFATIHRRAAGTGPWMPGSSVRLVRVAGLEYLRTDANPVESDHLGNLPAF